MKIFRLKALIPLLIFSVSVFIILNFFIDRIVKNIFISIGESIFSAKVDIASLKVKGLSISIKGLQVANKNDPWKNLFEIERVSFKIKFLPLLSKKVIIDEVAAEGIKWSTKRKTYGGLPPKKLKKIEKKKQKEDKDSFTYKLMASLKQKAEKEYAELPIVKNIKQFDQELKSLDINKIISQADLESKKLIERLSNEYSQKYENYKNEIQNIDIEQKIKTTQELINEVSNIKIEKIEDIKILQDKLAKLNETKKSLEETIEKLKNIKSSFEKDFVETKEVYSQIEKSVQNDYKNILNQLKLPELTKESITKALFGEVWLNRVNTAVYYIHLARKYLPARKKEDKKTLKQRAKGIDVVFHKENVLPNLWIKKISISGTTGGEGKDNENAISLIGFAENITSDQIIIGKPTLLKFEGKKLPQEYELECFFDRIQEPPKDTIKLNVKNLNVKEIKIADSDVIPSIKSGRVSLGATFSLQREELNCEMLFSIENIKYSGLTQKDELKEILYEIFKSIDKVYISAKLYGKIDSLSTEISSNLDDVITNKLKFLFGQKIQEYQLRIKSEVEKSIKEQKEKFFKEYIAKKDELLKVINDKKTSLEEVKLQIDKKIKESNEKIEEQKNKLNKTIEQEKKKLEEELKKKLFKY